MHLVNIKVFQITFNKKMNNKFYGIFWNEHIFFGKRNFKIKKKINNL